MQVTCPTCHASFPLEAALKDDAGRELVALFAGLQPGLALPLMHYLAFFRPAKQQLGWGRALRLAREVVALLPCPVELLIGGLEEANRALDEKRLQGSWKPLGNHNYLRRCLEGVQARAGATVGMPEHELRTTTAGPRSKAGQAMVQLEGMRR